MLYGDFPGPDTHLSKEEATALQYCLSKLPWWSSSAKEFPELLCASRQESLLPLLERMNLKEAWDLWHYWDRWTCIVVLLCTSAPIINLGTSIEDAEFGSLISVLDSLLHSMEHKDSSLGIGIFEKLVAENPEEEVAPAGNPSIYDSDLDDTPLPDLPELQELDDDKEDNSMAVDKKESPVRKSLVLIFI
jgi:hypothetical protein